MMRYDVLYNFISPVTGRILCDPVNYILIGNRQGVAVPSPMLIDIRLDLIRLRQAYNELIMGDIIIGHPNPQLANAQVLVNLDNGLMYNQDGTVIIESILPPGLLPDLTHNYLWLGNALNRPIEVPQILQQNLPNLTYQQLWTGNTLNRPIIVQRIQLSNLPSMGLPGYVPLEIPGRSLFGYKQVWTGDLFGNPTTTVTLDIDNMADLEEDYIWIGKKVTVPLITEPILNAINNFVPIPGVVPVTVQNFLKNITGYAAEKYLTLNRPTPIRYLPIGNLPNLDLNKIWMGNLHQRPVVTGLAPGQIFIGNTDPFRANQITTTGLALGRIFIGNAQGQIVSTGLNAGQMFIGEYDNSGEIVSIGLPAGRIFIGSPDNSGQIVNTGLNAGQIFIGSYDDSGQIISTGLDAGRMFIGSYDDSGTIVSIGLRAGQIFIGSYDDSGTIIGTGLEPGFIFIGSYDNPGQIISVGLPAGQMFIGASDNSGQIVVTGLNTGWIFIGNDEGQIIQQGLSVGYIFIGGAGNELTEQGLNAGQMFIGDLDNSGQIVTTGLDANFIFIGMDDDSGIITSTLLQIDTGTGLTGGPIHASGTISLADTGVEAADYTLEIDTGTGLTGGPIGITFTVNAQGQLTDIEPGFLNRVTGETGTISIADTGVVAGDYDWVSLTVNAQGQITAITSNTPSDGTVTEIDTGTGLTGGPITDTGTISIANTGIAPGTYYYATFTVNAQGQLTSATDNESDINDLQDAVDGLESLDGFAGFIAAGVAGFGAVVGAGVVAMRSIVSGNSSIVVTNGNGVLGNPTISASSNLYGFDTWGGTGIVVKQSSGTYTGVAVTGGTGISVSNGDGTAGNPTVSVSNTTVTPGSYSSADITVNAQGQITFAMNGVSGTVIEIDTGTGLTGGPITDFGTISIANTGVTAGSYTSANITVNAQGQITAASNGSGSGGTVTSITAGTGLSGGTITTSGTIALASTAVTPGTYIFPSTLTVNAQGQLTSVTAGVLPVTVITGTTNEITVSGTGTVNIAIANNPVLPGTGAVTVPSGTTAERPSTPELGMLRYNTDSGFMEIYV